MNHTQPIELHRQVIYKNQTAIELLQNNDDLTHEQVLQCFNNGAVWLETGGKPQRLYHAEHKLKPGHKIYCYCNSSTLTDCPVKAELVADYTDFSIWNKPSGMLCQGSKWGDHWALYRWIKQHHWPERESFITHRLDRFTSGLVIVAHTEVINKKFHRLFENRKIHKTYRAIVSGVMPENEQFTINTAINDKPAETIVKVLQQQVSLQQSLVEIKPKTGRKHQIRIHLAEIGHPVINDRHFGGPPFSGDLKLQASGLEFTHPAKNSNIHIRLDDADLLLQ